MGEELVKLLPRESWGSSLANLNRFYGRMVAAIKRAFHREWRESKLQSEEDPLEKVDETNI